MEANESRTHLGIDRSLSGRPVALAEGRATVELETTTAMAADAQGLVHGGFVFSAADYAAMLAVNDPFVVLSAASMRFLAPVRVGEVVTLEAHITGERGRRRSVAVEGRVGERPVVSGEFTAAVLDQHVLEMQR